MNELLIGNAVKFLNDATVRSSPLNKQLAFLRNKGLDEQEIEESYRRARLSYPPSQIQPSEPYYTVHQHEQQQEHLYQLARSSTTARWLLLAAVVASAVAFLARHLPAGLFERFLKWWRGGGGGEKQERMMVELGKKLDTIRMFTERLGQRQMQLEAEIKSLKAGKTGAEFDDCMD